MQDRTPQADGGDADATDVWAGALAGQRPDAAELVLRAVLGPAQPSSGAQAFPVSDLDGGRWYMKAPNNPQGGQVLATELLVSGLGDLIGVAVCRVRAMSITEEFVGFQVENGPQLEVGLGSASQEVADAVEIRGVLEYRNEDDNPERHAGVFALYDWCWGDDPQWLVVETDEHRLYSHDHGFYLPPGGQQWSRDTVEANVDVPHPLGGQTLDGLDVGELDRLAEALEAVEPSDLIPILAAVPVAWPVSDEDLEALGLYLHGRAPQVAERIKQLRATLEAG